MIVPHTDDWISHTRLKTWACLCLDNVLYHGRIVIILWGQIGTHYGQGKGLSIFVDGKRTANADTTKRPTAKFL